MSSIYERLGVRTIINAAGTLTRLSGTRMWPEAVEAMAEAARRLVRIDELEARASEVIAKVTGAEAGYVTSGAYAGLTLGTAACVTGFDVGKMARLPDTAGMKNEVVMARSHRQPYDHAIRAVGVRMVDVGSPRPTEREVEAAIGERTAAVAFAAGFDELSLEMVCRAAHRHEVPVIVDAAAELPPVENLRRYIAEGADLVTFSGGKAIRGPQASGILCGRRDLIAAAALQHWDMDVISELWDPPAELVDRTRLAGVPEHGIGRGFKVGKEEIVGLLVALEIFTKRDAAADRRDWDEVATTLTRELSGIEGVTLTVSRDRHGIPIVSLLIDPRAGWQTAVDVAAALKAGEPSVHVVENRAAEGVLAVNPFNVAPEELEPLARRLRETLAGAKP